MMTEVLLWVSAVLVAPTVVRILGEDAKTFIPRKCQALLRRSAALIHEDQSPALLEEWLAHLEECPELTGKLWHALSIYFWGARRIGALVGFSTTGVRSRMRAKRALDIFFVILAAPWAVPVVIGSTVFLLASGSRTPFVGAWRVGRGGKYFRIWKLNTSIENSRNPYRQRNDPVGNFFRRTAADELPQLWNVLVGEMSLVGPHAYQPGYEPKDPNSAYYASKPGLTGPWQLAGPLNRSPALRERLDEEYSRRSSLVLDLTILFQTTGLALKELKEK